MRKLFLALTVIFTVALCAYNDKPVQTADYKTLMQTFQKDAEKGDAKAMYNIGWLYENGKGVDQDYAKAMEWYRKAAALGNKDAISALEKMSKEQ